MSEVDLGSCWSGESTAVDPVNLLSSEAGELISVDDDVAMRAATPSLWFFSAPSSHLPSNWETGCSRKTTEMILSMVQAQEKSRLEKRQRFC